jgi:hypothetical protein
VLTAVALAIAALVMAACAPTKVQGPVQTPPSAASTAQSAPKPGCAEKINGKQATCATVIKTLFDPASFLPDYFEMSVKTDDGAVLLLKTPDPSSARAFNMILAPGSRIAYHLGDDEYLEENELKML